jgi:hypothetical protein
MCDAVGHHLYYDVENRFFVALTSMSALNSSVKILLKSFVLHR